MGISIQQYRACIGSFFPNGKTILKYSSTKPTKPTRFKPTRFKPTAFTCSLIIAVAVSLFFFSYSNYQHSMITTTSSTSIYAISSSVASDIIRVFNIFPVTFFTMISNFQSRCVNGNRSKKGIKIAHWNKGGSLLINKMPDIKTVIDQYKPHILGLSEANLLAINDQNLVAVPDYNLHVCPTITNPLLRTSRIVVYTHRDIVAKLRPDLMCNKYSSIWLEVGLPNHKRFLVCQSYREWQYTNQRGDKSSSTIPEQLNRWLVFLDQWERAMSTGMEVHCLGDMNLNHTVTGLIQIFQDQTSLISCGI